MLDEIELLGVDDLTGCLALAEDRGWTPREHLWRLLLQDCRCFGVRDEYRELAGTVVLTEYGSDLAAIGMMLVASRYGGRGIGRRLMDHALAQVGDTPVALYATDQGKPLYEKLGFVAFGTAYSHRGVFVPSTDQQRMLDAAADSGGSVAGIRSASLTDLPEMLALDADVFGADRQALLRRLPEFAERLLVATDADGAITGYGGGWDGNGLTVIGPVVAQTSGQAKQLITALATRADGPVMLDLEECRGGLRTWAAEHGLAERATTTVMVRGVDGLPGDRTRLFTPLAKALG